MPSKKKNKYNIVEINNDLPETEPIKEHFGVYIDDINPNLPRRNGTIWAICGKGGCGKTSLFLSLFKSKKLLRAKFDEVHYIVNSTSFNSAKSNPFKDHENIHHELTPDLLHDIHEDALQRREECIEMDIECEHTCIVIDDFGAMLKDYEIEHALKKIMNVARHANLYIVFLVQTFRMLPMELRRILTHVTLFKPNPEEWSIIKQEMLIDEPDKLEAIYKYVFSQPYNHLDLYLKENEIRKNFKLLQIDSI